MRKIEIERHCQHGGGTVVRKFELRVVEIAVAARVDQADLVLEDFLKLRQPVIEAHTNDWGKRVAGCIRKFGERVITQAMGAVREQVADAQTEYREILIPERFDAPVYVADERLGIGKCFRRGLHRIEHTEPDDVERHRLCIQQKTGRYLQIGRRDINTGQKVKDCLLRQGVVDDIRMGNGAASGDLDKYCRAILIYHSGKSAGRRIGRNRAVAARRIVLDLVPGFASGR